MSRTAAELLEEARRLPADQRTWLIDSLLDGEPDVTPEAWEAAWGSEIRQRIDELDSGRAHAAPLEDVLARMDARLQSHRRA
jgi:hypothetical protein